MSLRVRFLTVLACLAIFSIALSANNILVLPDTRVSNTIQVFTGNPLAPAGSFLAGAGPVVAATGNPQGTRNTVMTGVNVDSAVTTDEFFTVLSRSGEWNMPGVAAQYTPDGTYLLLLSGGVLRVQDAQTGLERAAVAAGLSPVDMALSIDSRYALVLSSVDRTLSKVDLTTFLVADSMEVPGGPTAISAGPNGLFYVSSINRVTVVDAESMEEVASIPLSGTPERMRFTPDGLYGVAANRTSETGTSVWIFDLVTNAMRSRVGMLGEKPPFQVVIDPAVQVVSNSRFFMTAQRSKVIYEVTIPDANLTSGWAPNGTSTPVGVTGIVKSGEFPEARHLFYSEQSNLKRVLLASDSDDAVPAVLSNTPVGLAYLGASSNGVPAGTIQYNAVQSIPAEEGASFMPIVVRAYDFDGLPVFGASVEFTSPVEGVTFPNAMTATNQDGLAMAYVDPGAETGLIPVTATIGNVLVAEFDLSRGDGGGGPGGGVRIISGQGQLVGDIHSVLADPLRVQVLKRDGTPVDAGNVVDWSITSGRGFLTSGSTTTDANGFADNFFQVPLLDPGISWEQSIVEARWGESFVEFYVTAYPNVGSGGVLLDPPNVHFTVPQQTGKALTGRSGQTLEEAMQGWVTTPAGAFPGGIPNVALFAGTGMLPELGQTANCVDRFALTNAEGFFSCDLVVGGQAGTASMKVTVGGDVFLTFPGYSITVLPGIPARVEPIQGSGQSGEPGETLTTQLVAEVRDEGGNLLPGEAVMWSVEPEGQATLSDAQTTTDELGRVSATATLGPAPGVAKIRVTSGVATGLFVLNIETTAAETRLVSGDGQTAVAGGAFSSPLVVKVVDADGAPISGVAVAFQVVAGSATIAPDSPITDSQGMASVTATAGQSAGAVRVTASAAGTNPVTFNLNVRLPGPGVTPASFLNGASGQPGLVPGGIADIYAPGLAPGLNGCVMADSPGELPLELAGVTVTFMSSTSSMRAHLFHVCNINGMEFAAIQTPFEVPVGNVSATVQVQGGSTRVDNIPVSGVQPGIFETTDASGIRHGVVVGSDGRYISPSNPANRGETLAMFATGLGPVSPPATTNAVGVPGQEVLANLVVGVNDAGVWVKGGEYAVNLVGVYVVYFEVPADTATGQTRPLALAVNVNGELVFAYGSTIAIQ